MRAIGAVPCRRFTELPRLRRPAPPGEELLASLVLEELGVAELAASRKLPRAVLLRALDAALRPGDPALPGCPAPWELAVYLTGRRDVTGVRRRAIAGHLESCAACVESRQVVAASLARPWARPASPAR